MDCYDSKFCGGSCEECNFDEQKETSKELQIFENQEFGKVRVAMIEKEPWFVGKDIAEILKYKEPHKAIVRHVEEDDRMKHPIIDSLGREQETWLINESGIYSLILSSEIPEAKKFKKWITSEVLPSIRKHGMYATDELLNNPDLLISIATKLKEERAKRIQAEQKIQVLQPKAEFFDAVAGSKDAIDMNRAAKLIYEETKLGRNKLFKFLREKRVLMHDNIPYQEYIDKGYFRTIEQKYNKPDGTTCIYIKTLVYQKGLDFIRKLLKSEGIIKSN
ncbi:MAG: phage antirepressor [Caloramator sp.]|nr:phage antirepressor [Caloramator sp.]